MINELNNCFKNLELILNIAAVIPGINIASSAARALLGKAQIIGGLSSAALHYSASLLVKDKAQKKEFEARAIKSCEYAVHGALNCIRAVADLIPLLSIALLVNDFLLDIGKYRYTPLNCRSNFPLPSFLKGHYQFN